MKAQSGYFSCHRTLCNTSIIGDYHSIFFCLHFHKEGAKATARVTFVTTWASVTRIHRLYSFLLITLVGGHVAVHYNDTDTSTLRISSSQR